MTHVRTSPYYPQSNGKVERWHKSLKSECIRPGTPLSLEDARRLVEGFVEHYNNVRLNSAIGYITPTDVLARRQQEIHAERDRKLEDARHSGDYPAAAARSPGGGRITSIRRSMSACRTIGSARFPLSRNSKPSRNPVVALPTNPLMPP